MSTIRHPNRRRNAASVLLSALIAWHGPRTQSEPLSLRHHWPRHPRSTPPDRTPPPAAAGGIAHAA